MIKLLLRPIYWQSIFIMSAAALKRTNKNSVLGSLWALIQPLVHMFLISYIFSFLLRQSPEIMIKNLAAGLPLWSFLSNSLQSSGNSLITREHIIKRFRTSKSLFVISDVSIHIVSLFYSIIAMFVLLMILHFKTLSFYMILAPFMAIPMIISVTAISIAIGFVTPYIRDIPQMLNLAISSLYWTVPIIYPYSIVPESKRIFFEYNPLFILIRPMQIIFVEQRMPDMIHLIKAAIVTLLAVLFSYYIYRKTNRNVVYYL